MVTNEGILSFYAGLFVTSILWRDMRASAFVEQLHTNVLSEKASDWPNFYILLESEDVAKPSGYFPLGLKCSCLFRMK